jgi:hypothetical protein
MYTPVIRWKMMPTAGEINCHRKKMKTNTKTRLFLSRVARRGELNGKNEKSILEPSRGGIGTKLNTASNIFIRTIIAIIEINDGGTVPTGRKRIARPKTVAIKRFTAGPAPATIASPQRLLRRLYGLNGTGFAQPIINPPTRCEIMGTSTDPTGSKCFRGFKVRRPSYSAVLSPSKFAAYP